MHCLRSYDGDHLINHVKPRHGKVRVIPTNMEKFLVIQIGKLMFLDSFQFAPQSLESLVKTLNEDDFIHTKSIFGENCQIFKKGVFFYDYFKSEEVLNETCLPSREHFHNRLEDKECSINDYEYAQQVWKEQNCQTIRDYHNLYLKSDVTLLADFFEKFRKMCMDYYGLEAAYYFSASSMSWDSALKMTGIELEIIDNEPQYTFFEQSIRGGVSQISLRKATANTPKMENYDSSKPRVDLLYVDCCNLYGKSMCESLPTGNFRWKEPDFDVSSVDDFSKKGYVAEIDAYFPDHLHDKFNDYPLAPENIIIDDTFLSPYQSNFPDEHKKPTKKLAPNLLPKKNYILHYRNLKFYKEQGMIITKVHRILEFDQEPWLAPYINFNTKMRAQSTSSFAKDFFKLLNNSIFGKTQENLRNRISVKIITDEKVAKKLVCKPDMKRSYTINENLVVIEMMIKSLELNKPLYVGFSVLELSKLTMYKFHYQQMTQWFNNITLAFTDTDSLLYKIIDQDIHQVMKEKEEHSLPDTKWKAEKSCGSFFCGNHRIQECEKGFRD